MSWEVSQQFQILQVENNQLGGIVLLTVKSPVVIYNNGRHVLYTYFDGLRDAIIYGYHMAYQNFETWYLASGILKTF